jgi:hypothetical protein
MNVGGRVSFIVIVTSALLAHSMMFDAATQDWKTISPGEQTTFKDKFDALHRSDDNECRLISFMCDDNGDPAPRVMQQPSDVGGDALRPSGEQLFGRTFLRHRKPCVPPLIHTLTFCIMHICTQVGAHGVRSHQ